MKNLLYIILFFTGSWLYAQQTSVEVRAGYHNRSCLGGVGFCSDSGSAFKDTKGAANASLMYSSSSELIMRIPVKQLSAEDMAYLQKENTFEVSGSQDIILSNKLLERLKLNSAINKIKSGKYPVRISEEFIDVYFNMSK